MDLDYGSGKEFVRALEEIKPQGLKDKVLVDL